MTIHDILDRHSLTQTGLSRLTGIPLRTVQGWCNGTRTPAPWVIALIEYRINNDKEINNA